MDSADVQGQIKAARSRIDPAFLNTPQFKADALRAHLGRAPVLKVETVNPIRSFKGRGASLLVDAVKPGTHLVCASVGNFGQGMAYTARARGVSLTVFLAENANPLKVERIKSFGAEVVQSGADFDAAKSAAKEFARSKEYSFVEDGAAPEITIGAGTIGLEMLERNEKISAVIVSVGNGALLNGVASWIKQNRPDVRVIGVCSKGAPAMAMSWKQGSAISTVSTSTVAEGIAVREPVPAAVDLMTELADDIPWSNGKVVMRGGSYRGMTQWMAARTCPDAIDTLIPTASVYPGHDFPTVAGHRSQKYTAAWLAFVSGAAMNSNLYADSEFWQERELTSYREHVPFHQYDAFVGAPSEHFQAWVARLSDPTAWATFAWTPEDYAEMRMPILTITGHYDGDQPGALRYFREHQASVSRGVAKDHYLVMGPWSHGGTREPRRVLAEGVEFGPAAVFDMDQFNLDWFDWRTGGGPKPAFLKGRVAYYVGGAEAWRHADSLEDIADDRKVLYISAALDEANDVFRSGHLVDSPVAGEAPHRIVSDPLDTTPADLTDVDWNAIRDGVFRSTASAHMPQTLVFHSEPLAEGTTLAGQMRLALSLEMDAPDADIFATVYAIFPDGKPLYLGGDVVRARFRDGLEPKLVAPSTVQPYVFENFLWNAWALPAGTRLRLTIGPYNDPSAQKNYNSGGRLGYETREDARIAQIKLHHDAVHPSVLEIPIVTN